MALRPTVFDDDVLAFDKAHLVQSPAELARKFARRFSEAPFRKPTTGIAGCWARTASGQVPRCQEE